MMCLQAAIAQPNWVQAIPHLNLRDTLNEQEILLELPYGAQVEFIRSTEKRDTLNGMPGEWVVVMDASSGEKGQVFNAYLWPLDVPTGFDASEDYPEDFDAYCARSVDGMRALIWGQTFENYGGPESGTSYLDVECTQGQAMRMLRHWIQAIYGDGFAHQRLNLQDPSRWRAIMEEPWDPVNDPIWWIGFFSEGGSSSWSLELSPNFKSDNRSKQKLIFRLSHSSGSC